MPYFNVIEIDEQMSDGEPNDLDFLYHAIFSSDFCCCMKKIFSGARFAYCCVSGAVSRQVYSAHTRTISLHHKRTQNQLLFPEIDQLALPTLAHGVTPICHLRTHVPYVTPTV